MRASFDLIAIVLCDFDQVSIEISYVNRVHFSKRALLPHRAQEDVDFTRTEVSLPIFEAIARRKANVRSTRARMPGFWLKFLTCEMQVNLLMTKSQCESIIFKSDNAKSKHSAIEVTRRLDVADCKHKVIDRID